MEAPLDRAARELGRLPGGTTEEERDWILAQLDPERAAAFQSSLSEPERKAFETGWRRTLKVGGLPLYARPYRSRNRPEVFARFVTYIIPSSDWFVSGYLARNGDGRPVITDLTLEPVSHAAAEITSPVLRAVSPSWITAKAFAFMQDWAAMESSEVEQKARAAAAGVSTEDLKRGRAGYPEDHYRRVALDYLDLLELGVTKGILSQLADDYDRPKATVRDWVHRARELGFLTAGRRGGAGAEPGPRLYETEEEQ